MEGTRHIEIVLSKMQSSCRYCKHLKIYLHQSLPLWERFTCTKGGHLTGLTNPQPWKLWSLCTSKWESFWIVSRLTEVLCMDWKQTMPLESRRSFSFSVCFEQILNKIGLRFHCNQLYCQIRVSLYLCLSLSSPCPIGIYPSIPIQNSEKNTGHPVLSYSS